MKNELYEITEVCPYCDGEQTFLWNTDLYGYEVVCPECGNKMMLCNDCYHTPDNLEHKCDWCEDHGCFRKRKDNI